MSFEKYIVSLYYSFGEKKKSETYIFHNIFSNRIDTSYYIYEDFYPLVSKCHNESLSANKFLLFIWHWLVPDSLIKATYILIALNLASFPYFSLRDVLDIATFCVQIYYNRITKFLSCCCF